MTDERMPTPVAIAEIGKVVEQLKVLRGLDLADFIELLVALSVAMMEQGRGPERTAEFLARDLAPAEGSKH